jgi:Ni,Fe-hydrogenase III small subunit/formate hydrogenlyase subunit 6/NADH:ubiquinone oxidoreductase subunit I
MLTILRESLLTGRVTEAYPRGAATTVCRGRPEIDPGRCDCSAACVSACPSGAITLTPTDAGLRWRLDLAECVYCGLCAAACPTGAITMTHDVELAARTRAALVVGITHQTTPPPPLGANPAPAAKLTVPVVPADTLGQRLGDRIRRVLRRSLHIRHMAAGGDNSCDWEIAALLNPVYDVQRLGIDFVASPRHADLLLVTGAVTRHLEPALRATYEAMPAPRLVVAAGSEACGGGVLQGSYAVAGGVDRCLPVDVYIPGDPPPPDALIHGLLVALERRNPSVGQNERIAVSTSPSPASPTA